MKLDYDKVRNNFFNDFSQRYSDINFLDMTPADLLEFDTFIDFFGLQSGSKVIELGCGAGRYVIPLLNLGFEVTGVDISDKSLDVLHKHAERLGLISNLELVQSDFSKKLYENAFDGAYCISTFHLLAGEEKDRINIFQNLISAVKPNGSIIVLEPNPLNVFYYPYYLLSQEADWKIEKHFLKSYAKHLAHIYSKVGLTNIEVKQYGMVPTRFMNKIPNIKKINEFTCKVPFLKNFSLFTFIKGRKSN